MTIGCLGDTLPMLGPDQAQYKPKLDKRDEPTPELRNWKQPVIVFDPELAWNATQDMSKD